MPKIDHNLGNFCATTLMSLKGSEPKFLLLSKLRSHYNYRSNSISVKKEKSLVDEGKDTIFYSMITERDAGWIIKMLQLLINF